MKTLIRRILWYLPLFHDILAFRNGRPLRIKLKAAFNVFSWRSDIFLKLMDEQVAILRKKDSWVEYEAAKGHTDRAQVLSNKAYDRLMKLQDMYTQYQRANYWFY